jgi:hypothetical protein
MREKAMSSDENDYHNDIRIILKELAFDAYGCDPWDLPKDEQSRLYRLAELEYAYRMADRADYLRKVD